MARDYKNTRPKKTTTKKKTSRKKAVTKKKTTKRATTRKAEEKKGLPAWLWFVGGILCTFIFFQAKNYFDNQSTIDPVDSPKQVEPYSSRVEAQNEETESPKTSVKEPEPKKEPFELKKDPRFTFYEQLPKNEVIIPEEALRIEVDENKKENLAPIEDITQQGTYVLQAGSFLDFADADRRKAELALLGLESSIQKVTIKSTDWYRVRIGPFIELDVLNTTRQNLRSGSIDALVIRTE